MTAFKVALAGFGLLASTALVTPSVALAQAQQAPEREYKLSRAEQAAIGPLIAANLATETARKAGQTPDLAQVRALLPAAEAAAKSNDAKYLVARIQLNLALAANDLAAQERALTVLLASSSTPANERAIYQTAMADMANKRAEAAFTAGDYATAERLYRELLAANPTDTRLQNNLRIVQERSGNTAGASQSALAQIQAAEAAGGVASEDTYRSVFNTHYRANQRAEAAAALGNLIRAYPTAANVQLGVSLMRDNTPVLIDALRFARVAGALQPTQYVPLAAELDQAGLPGETIAVLDAAAAAGVPSSGTVSQLRANAQRRIGEDRASLNSQIAQARSAASGRSARIVADALYGYGRFTEAAELYRLALSKGGEDAGLINLRLGAALAGAGQRTEAEAAFRAVTGSRAELAQLWLGWLARRTG